MLIDSSALRLVLVCGPPASGKATIAGPLAAAPVEVFCECPAEVRLQRYAERAAVRHPVHADDSQLCRLPALVARSGRPFGLRPVLTVDTTAPVDIPALSQAVQARLRSVRAGRLPD